MQQRAALATRDGIGLAVVGLSSPLGIEYLDPADAGPLLRAYHHGVAGLGETFAGWAAACLTEIDAPGLARLLDRGFVGLQLPATALADEAGYRRCGPLLDVLAGRDRPLFIHPGPAGPGASGDRGPCWWAAVVPYVQQLHAAWFAFRAWGRPAYPRLRVCFTALAGLAPLHGERLAARGGTDPLTRGIIDPGMFVETSSYGHRAVDAVLRVLGVDALVLGSDRPYAEPLPAAGLAPRCTTRSAWPTRPGCCTVTRRRPARLPRTSGSPRTPASDHPLPARGVTAVTFPALPARYLDQDELTALVDNLAARPEAWRDQVDDRRRHPALRVPAPRRVRGRLAHLLVPGQRHRAGTTTTCRPGRSAWSAASSPSPSPRIGGAHTRAVVPEGRSFSFGPDHIHRLTGEADQAVSLHAYSPPLWRLGQYTIDDDGVMRRVSVCYADELRPLDAPSAGQPAAQPV